MSTVAFETAERYQTKCYRLNGITYVPHKKYSGFAYPGMTKKDLPISEIDLQKLGATQVDEWLYGTTFKKAD